MKKKLTKQQINKMAVEAKTDVQQFQQLYFEMANFFEAYFKTLYQSHNFVYRQYLDDLKNELYLLFPNIISNFDSTASKKGYEVDFRTYISWYFKKLCNETMQHLKSDIKLHQKLRGELSTFELDAPTSDEKLIVEAIIANEDYLNLEEKEYATQKIDAALDCLTEKEKFIFKKKATSNLNWEEISQKLFEAGHTKQKKNRETIRLCFLKIQKKIAKRIKF